MTALPHPFPVPRSRRSGIAAVMVVLALAATGGVARSGTGRPVAPTSDGVPTRAADALVVAGRRAYGVAAPPVERDAPVVVDVATTTTTTMPPRALPVRLAPVAPGPLLGTLIVVDPGHNGANSSHTGVRRPDGHECNTAGSSTGRVDEVDINWAVGVRVTRLLRSLGAEVVVTRGGNDGFGPCADERGRVAKEVGATALLSIHADGATRGSGFHVIHPAPSERLSADSVDGSARLAGLVRDELVTVGGRPANYAGRGGTHQRGDLANLNQADRPSVLVELGNLRHPLDAAMLTDPVTHEIVARAMARALVRFVDRPVFDGRLSADLGVDGWPDLLAGAPQLEALGALVEPPGG